MRQSILLGVLLIMLAMFDVQGQPGKDQLRYVAGSDAKAMYSKRLEVGEEKYRKGIEQTFIDD